MRCLDICVAVLYIVGGAALNTGGESRRSYSGCSPYNTACPCKTWERGCFKCPCLSVPSTSPDTTTTITATTTTTTSTTASATTTTTTTSTASPATTTSTTTSTVFPTTTTRASHPATSSLKTATAATKANTHAPSTQRSTTISSASSNLKAGPTECVVCSGPVQICERVYHTQTCNPPNNYCINHVTNFASGARFVNRTCGDFPTCEMEWYFGTSDNDKCNSFDSIYTLDFGCTFCCVEDDCNIPIRPKGSSLYTPKQHS